MLMRFVYGYLPPLLQTQDLHWKHIRILNCTFHLFEKISDINSSWQEILSGVRQDSILGLLLLHIDCNIDICDITHWHMRSAFGRIAISQIRRKTADHICQRENFKVLNTLEDGSPNFFKSFSGYKLKANASKSHLLIAWWKQACKCRYITD